MAVEERDPHTGYLTTGHEWDGIKELNTPVPRLVYFCLAATALFAVIYWFLMPAWPVGATFTKGLLGIDQRTSVQDSLKDAALQRAVWAKRLETQSFADIQADSRLMEIVRQTGPALFGDNCAACHGARAAGGPGYPSLVDDAWLWGGNPETIAETIRAGVNSAHPDSRVSQMLAFGRDQVLARGDIKNVAAYVQSLSGSSGASSGGIGDAGAGQTIFADNCASCHGESGRGNTQLGAPDLTDKNWIYGGDAQSIFTTIWGGRQGRMPAWEARLSPVDRKILTLYLIGLKAAKQ